MKVMAIGDTQIPFMHEDAIAFLKHVYEKEKPNHVVQIGDLFDQYFANAWGKSAMAMSTEAEFKLGLEVLHDELLPIFGKTPVSIVIGNHDERLHKRADEAGIHEVFLRSLRDIYKLPKNIPLEYKYVFDGVTYLHGHTVHCAVKTASSILTTEFDTSVVYGHFHSQAAITYMANHRRLLWGFNLGCLIDRNHYAFHYGRAFKEKPILGVGIIVDGIPHYIPMVLDINNRWVGRKQKSHELAKAS